VIAAHHLSELQHHLPRQELGGVLLLILVYLLVLQVMYIVLEREILLLFRGVLLVAVAVWDWHLEDYMRLSPPSYLEEAEVVQPSPVVEEQRSNSMEARIDLRYVSTHNTLVSKAHTTHHRLIFLLTITILFT
jgi:hypothetical protein